MKGYDQINNLLDTNSKSILLQQHPVFGKKDNSFHITLIQNRFSLKFILNVIELLIKNNELTSVKSLYDYFLSIKETRKSTLAKSYLTFCINFLDVKSTRIAFQHTRNLTNRVAPHHEYGSYLIKNNQYVEAEQVYKSVDTKVFSTQVNFGLAEVYKKTNMLTKAIDLYKLVTAKYSNNASAWRLLREAEELLWRESNSNTENQIIKSISFKSEHQKAGITILQNFGNLLNEKYPEGGVAFTIKQDGFKVIMIIEHPAGEKETVEDYLNRYGLVVTGKIPPEEFSSDPIMVLDLKRQLIQVESDLKWSNEKQSLLTNTINGQDRQIETLSSQLKYFQNQLTDVLSSKHLEIKSLLELVNRGDIQTESLIQPLIKSINSENKQETQNALKHIKSNDSSLFQKLNDLVLNTMASSSANAPAWIEYLSKVLP